MIAPSPDCVIGVSGYDLMPGGNWIDNATVTLYAYGAGTDDGVSYGSSNADTDPQGLITQIITTPFLVDSAVVPVGTLEVSRIE